MAFWISYRKRQRPVLAAVNQIPRFAIVAAMKELHADKLASFELSAGDDRLSEIGRAHV